MPNFIVIITAAFAVGIWCARFCHDHWALPLLYIASLIVMIVMVWQIDRQKSQVCSVGALFFLMGMIRFLHADALPFTDISRYAGQTMMISGSISEEPKVTELEGGKSAVRYLLLIKDGKIIDNNPIPLTGVVIVSVRQSNQIPLAHQEDEISVVGQVVLLHGYNNPAQYDSVAAAARQEIRTRMSSQSQDVQIVRNNSTLSWNHRFAIWREEIIQNMRSVMPSEHVALLSGMLFGGYGGIPREIVADFATTGIVHILSVSGSHIALVVGVITALGHLLTRRVALPAMLVPALAGVVVTFYAVFCGLTPPVLRSLIMGLIALVAICVEREKDAKNGLLLSALGMLIQTPALIYDLSFQLSFASTAGLVFLNSKTVDMLEALPSWLAKLSAVTISAQLGVLPFIAWYFNSFSISSFIANVIIVPLIELLVVIGLLGAIVGMIVGVFGHIMMIVCSLLLSMVIQCTAWLAMMPVAKIYIPPIGLTQGGVYYVLLAWLYGYKPLYMLSFTEAVEKWPRQLLLFLLAMIIFITGYNIYPRPVYVHFIDVGQGDATLILTPHGRAILVDTGGVMGEDNTFDIGDRVVVPYLKHYGVLAIDYLFLTHGHQDHAGGAAAVAREIPVRNSMLAREEYTQAVRNLVNGAHGSFFIPVYEGQQIEIDGVMIHVLHAVSGTHASHNNEVSSVIQVCYGEHSFLLTGDLEKTGEEQMLARGQDLQSTVLKIGHHGAKTSSTLAFLQAVAPKYAIISVGKNNHFGHPHPETIKRLLEKQSKIYRTDEQGAIVFTTDGRAMHVDTFLN